MRRDGEGRARQPGLNPQTITTTTSGEAIIAEATTPVLVDYLAWRCRTGRCVPRPLHDHLDWWPAWTLEARWSA